MDVCWVYRKTGFNPDLFTVGYYDHKGVWRPESDWLTSEEAAERVHYLNGGAKRP